MRLLGLLLVLVPLGAYALQYKVVEVGVPPLGLTVEGLALNEAQTVVGVRGQYWYGQGFRWSAEAGARLLFPSLSYRAHSSMAYDVNEAGVVAGYVSAPNRRPALFHPDGTVERLPFPPGALGAWAVALNDVGDVVIYADGVGVYDGYVWRRGEGLTRMLPLVRSSVYPTRVNNDGVVCGYGTDGVNSRAWRWTRSQGFEDLRILPGLDDTVRAHDINDEGTILGHWTGFLTSGGFIWTVREGLRNLELPLGAIPNGLNDKGLIVGAWTHSQPKEVDAFISDGIGDFRLLNDMLEPGSRQYDVRYAVDVNNNGVILAIVLVGREARSVLLYPVE